MVSWRKPVNQAKIAKYIQERINLPKLFIKRKLNFFYDIQRRPGGIGDDLTKEAVSIHPQPFINFVGGNMDLAIEMTQDKAKWSEFEKERLEKMTPLFRNFGNNFGNTAGETSNNQQLVN